jgi:hypothetical protein
VNPLDNHFNAICEGGFKEYRGTAHCAYNIARAFIESKHWLEKSVSEKEE